jgi:hypothetical protein
MGGESVAQENCDCLTASTQESRSSRLVLNFEDRDDGLHVLLSRSAFEIVRRTGRILRHLTGERCSLIRGLPVNEFLNGLRPIFSDPKFFPECRDFVSSIHSADHKMTLVTELANRYLGVWIEQLLKFTNAEFVFGKTPISRHKLTKMPHLRGL